MAEAQKSDFEKLLQIRRENKLKALQEAKSKHPWIIWDEGPDLYQRDLRVFSEPLSSFLERRQKEGRKAYVLDLMGGGGVLRKLPIGGGLAITLGDGREHQLKKQDTAKNIELITGDILSKRTWKYTQEWLKEKRLEGFDLILCRPAGGWSGIPVGEDIYYALLNNTWHSLSPQDGMLLIGLPNFLLPVEGYEYKGDWIHLLRVSLKLPAWINQLKESGIDIQYKERSYPVQQIGSLKLVKHPDSPLDLPKFVEHK